VKLALPTDDHGIVRLRRTGAIVQEGQLRRGAFFWTLEMLKINEAEVAAERPLLQPLPLFGRHQHDRLVTGKRDSHRPTAGLYIFRGCGQPTRGM